MHNHCVMTYPPDGYFVVLRFELPATLKLILWNTGIAFKSSYVTPEIAGTAKDTFASVKTDELTPSLLLSNHTAKNSVVKSMVIRFFLSKKEFTTPFYCPSFSYYMVLASCRYTKFTIQTSLAYHIYPDQVNTSNPACTRACMHLHVLTHKYPQAIFIYITYCKENLS